MHYVGPCTLLEAAALHSAGRKAPGAGATSAGPLQRGRASFPGSFCHPKPCQPPRVVITCQVCKPGTYEKPGTLACIRYWPDAREVSALVQGPKMTYNKKLNNLISKNIIYVAHTKFQLET